MRRRFAVKIIVPVTIAACLAVAAYAAGRADLEQSPARFLSSYELSAKAKWFGGFSAIVLGPNGRNVFVLTDRSDLVSGQIARTDGKITHVSFDKHSHLRNTRGQAMVSDRDSVDSEGLALGSDGTIFVSFEGRARVSRYATADAAAEDLPRPKAFTAFRDNKALEALAVDGAGQLYTLPENAPGDAYPVWIWTGTDWQQPFSIPKDRGYLPVGLDIGPDGRFYLLERKFVIVGFRSRLRRWDLTPKGLRNETQLVATSIGTHDNLEGLSVWRAEDGKLRATMVSDNNFMPFQRSELVEYLLPE